MSWIRIGLVLIGVVILIFAVILPFFRKYNRYLIHKADFPYSILKAAGLQQFGEYLGILRQIIGEITVQDDGILQFGYIVPDHLCHNHPTKEVYLDLGALLALTDEITTVILICQDKSYRPGVSVTLSGELYCHDIKPGQNILIEACATKIGSTLAFTEIYFLSLKDKSTLARGSHIKFMKMGFIWDLMSPFIPSILQQFLKHYRQFYPSTPASPVTGSPSAGFSPKRSTKSNKPSLESLFSLQSKHSSTSSQRKEYSLVTHETILNYSQNMHGGAIALAFQEAVWQYCKESNLPIRRIRCMEISYLAPCKGSLLITVTPLHHLQPSISSQLSFKEEHQQDHDEITYDPIASPLDTFRVLIRKSNKEESNKGGKKSSKNNQIYAQGMIILY